MEFLLFLTDDAKAILESIQRANVSVQEDAIPCWQHLKLFGGLQREKRRLISFTANIRRSGKDVKKYVNQTLLHEAVHVVQLCKNNKPLGYNIRNMHLTPIKNQFLENSTKFSGSTKKEREAYWLEDKPRRIKSLLRKYCDT